MNRIKKLLMVAAVIELTASWALVQGARPTDWDKIVEAAKQKGKVVVSIPSSADLRKDMQNAFKQRYRIEVETVTARESASVRKIVKTVGIIAAKDIYPPEEYAKRENNFQEKIETVREPAAELARKLLGQ